MIMTESKRILPWDPVCTVWGLVTVVDLSMDEGFVGWAGRAGTQGGQIMAIHSSQIGLMCSACANACNRTQYSTDPARSLAAWCCVYSWAQHVEAHRRTGASSGTAAESDQVVRTSAHQGRRSSTLARRGLEGDRPPQG